MWWIDDDSDDDGVDDDPIVEEKFFMHQGGINRIRVSFCVLLCDVLRRYMSADICPVLWFSVCHNNLISLPHKLIRARYLNQYSPLLRLAFCDTWMTFLLGARV